MAHGETPGPLQTGIQSDANTPTRGQLVVRDSTTDDQSVKRSGANTARPAGVVWQDAEGQGKPLTFADRGIVKVKAGAGVTAGQYVESDANGNAINATAGAGRNVFGQFLESGLVNDLVPVRLDPATITV